MCGAKNPLPESPDHRSLSINLHHKVEISRANQCVAVSHSGDGIGMSPALITDILVGRFIKVVPGIPLPHNLPLRAYLSYLGILFPVIGTEGKNGIAIG